MPSQGVPKYHEMMNPLLKAIKQLGGSGSITEIEETTFSLMGLSQETLAIPKYENQPSPSKGSDNLAWARSYLKGAGLLDNSSRGIWSLTQEGWKAEFIDEKKLIADVKRKVAAEAKHKNAVRDSEIIEAEDGSWQEKALQLVGNLKPEAFERLAQRLLRESGFVQVEVTGRSGDGGIDGKGILRLGDLMSFHVMFQCKRYQNPVGAGVVRDFRGALQGRADRGLLITSSVFTREAKAEASRDGTTPIELIDGEELVKLMKEKGLGLRVEKVESEQVYIVEEWFKEI